MRVLLVEDDAAIARAVQFALARDGIFCTVAENARTGIDMCCAYDVDAILLDLKLPPVSGTRISGKDVLIHLRRSKINVPIMIISGSTSGKNGASTVSEMLDFGADDFVLKPFKMVELISRINAVVRRSRGHATSVITHGRLSIKLDERMVEIDGRPVNLTSKEYGILELLMLRKGTVQPKEAFLDHLYAGIDEPELKIIDVFVCKARRKLKIASNGESFIETAWGRGYTLKSESQMAKGGCVVNSENNLELPNLELPNNQVSVSYNGDDDEERIS